MRARPSLALVVIARVQKNKKSMTDANEKHRKEYIENTVLRRKLLEKMVLEVQFQLIFCEQAPAETLRQHLKLSATYLTPQQYNAVVEERVVSKCCGYTLCKNTLAARSQSSRKKNSLDKVCVEI